MLSQLAATSRNVDVFKNAVIGQTDRHHTSEIILDSLKTFLKSLNPSMTIYRRIRKLIGQILRRRL